MRICSTSRRRRAGAIAAAVIGAASLAIGAVSLAIAAGTRADHLPPVPSPAAASPPCVTATSSPRAAPTPSARGHPRAWSPQALHAAAVVSQFVRLGSRGATPAARALLADDQRWPRLLAEAQHRRLIWLHPASETPGCVGMLACLDERSSQGISSHRSVTLLFTVRAFADENAWLISAIAPS